MRERLSGSKKLWMAAVVLPLLAAGQLGIAATTAQSAAGSNPGAQAPLTPAQAATLSTGVTNKVIVVLKDQVPQAPASPPPSAPGAASRPGPARDR